jgi:hypothetical protein
MFWCARRGYAAPAGSRFATAAAIGSTEGRAATYVGERCSIVTCAAVGAIAGTSVIAVAPLPITTTRLPPRSRSAGQCCGARRCRREVGAALEPGSNPWS